MTRIEIPAGTVPRENLFPGPATGWDWRKWKAIGFKAQGPPPWAVPAGCSVMVRFGDLLGPEAEPFREFHRVEFVAV